MTDQQNNGGQSWLPADLSPEQRRAVTAGDGPLLIDAGAGSGKTRTIVYRIAHLLRQKVPAHRLLAVTFTTPAAAELAERVRAVTGAAVRCGTFHSWACEILRRHTKGSSKVYDDRHVRHLMDNLLHSARGMATCLSGQAQALTVDDVKSAISWNKNVGHATPDAFVAPQGFDAASAELARAVWARYEEIKQHDGGMDFDDMLLRAVQLLYENDKVRNACHQQWRHILVDEFQDANGLQFQMVRMVVENAPCETEDAPARAVDWRGRTLTVCGDADQSIYGFRAANVRLILSFTRCYPEAAVVPLATNYRSTGNIVRAAGSVVANNTERTPKQLAARGPEGVRLSLRRVNGEDEEARFVASAVRRLLAANGAGPETPRPSLAILFRRNSQMKAFRSALRAQGIRARMTGGVSIERHPDIKLMAAILRAAANPRDNRALSQAARAAFPYGFEREFVNEAARAGITLWDKLLNDDSEQAVKLRSLICGVIDAARHCSPLSAISVIDGYTHALTRLVRGQTPDAQDMLEALIDQITQIPEGATLTGIAQVLERPLPSDKSVVELLTVHGAKGLEWDVVFLVGLEEGIFPDSESPVEEERRLFYVALTRARRKLFLTCPASASRFVGELPAECVVLSTGEQA